jgi:hypothetical protein
MQARAAKMEGLLSAGGGFKVEARNRLDLEADNNPVMMKYVEERLQQMRGTPTVDAQAAAKQQVVPDPDDVYALPASAAAALAEAQATKREKDANATPLMMNIGLAEVELPDAYKDSNEAVSTHRAHSTPAHPPACTLERRLSVDAYSVSSGDEPRYFVLLIFAGNKTSDAAALESACNKHGLIIQVRAPVRAPPGGGVLLPGGACSSRECAGKCYDASCLCRPVVGGSMTSNYSSQVDDYSNKMRGGMDGGDGEAADDAMVHLYSKGKGGR